MKKKKGFTLVELIVVMAISVIFGAIVLTISVTSGNLFSMTQTDSVFNDQGRLAIGWIEDDLRTAREIIPYNAMALPTTSIKIATNSYEVSVASKIVATFIKNENGVEQKYAYLQQGTIIKRMKVDSTGNLKDISTGVNNVESFTVTRNETDTTDKRYFINIKLKNAKGETAEYSSVVTPRN